MCSGRLHRLYRLKVLAMLGDPTQRMRTSATEVRAETEGCVRAGVAARRLTAAHEYLRELVCMLSKAERGKEN